MRKIDADELTEWVWRKRVDSRELIADLIASMPTIEAEPIKHGKWWLQKIPYKGGHGLTATKYRCSACRLYNNKKTKYCPNCGADMREVKGGKV